MPRPKSQNRADIRTERISLALTPVVYDGIKTLAEIKGISVNDLLNSVAAFLVERNRNTIAEFAADRKRHADALNLSVADDEPEK